MSLSRLIASTVFIALAGLPPSSGIARGTDAGVPTHIQSQQNLRMHRRESMDAVFLKALASQNQDYLDAEQQLLHGGQEAMTTLRANLACPDLVGQLIARQLLARMEGKAPDVQPALAYLDDLPQSLARTPISAPSPMGVAAYLGMHFDARVADFMAVRLVKITQDPRWRVSGMLLYLKQEAQPSTTAALIRFAAETPNDEWRKVAVEAIEDIDDPALQTKLQFERQRMMLLRREFPNALTQMLKT